MTSKKVYEVVVGAPREVPGLGLLEPGKIYSWDEGALELYHFQAQMGVPLDEANFTDPMVKMRIRDAEVEEPADEETSEEITDEETEEEA